MDSEKPKEAMTVTEEGSQSTALETEPLQEVDWNAQVVHLEQEIAHSQENLLRALADLDNLRKQALREKEEARKYAITGFVRDLLPVADNLERAVSCFPESTADPKIKTVIEGIVFVQKELNALLERYKIERVGFLGEKFDPNLHQAMLEVETDDGESGLIVQVLQEGYKLYDRLLRPALVGVSKIKKDTPKAPK